MFFRKSNSESENSGDSFAIVVLPDSQRYVEDGFRSERLFCLKQQISWIIDNCDERRIKFVTHVGDYVQNRDCALERAAFFKQINRLTGIVPFGVCAGNHDILLGDQAERILKGRGKSVKPEMFDQPFVRKVRDSYFSPSKYQPYGYWVGDCNDCQSNAQIFKVSKQNFLIIHIEFGPSDFTLDWANGILEAHSDIPAFITTHNFITPEEKSGLTSKSSRLSTGQDDMVGEGDNAGEDIFNKIVIPNDNVFMVFCGHYAAQRYMVLESGKRKVHALLCDYEQEQPYYGNGWLRILDFHPRDGVVKVSTYSPVFDKFKSDPDNMFTIRCAPSKETG